MMRRLDMRGKTTVSEILTRAKDAEIVWPIELGDKQLMSRLYPPAESKTSVKGSMGVRLHKFTK